MSKDYRQQLHNIFLQVLIGLPLEEFKSIKFEELLRRAHEREPDLKINEKIKATLAYHFRLKQLKDLARDKRQDEGRQAPVPFGQSVCAPEAPTTAQAPAAAAIDGSRPGGTQVRRKDQDLRPEQATAKRRRLDEFDYDSGENDADAGGNVDNEQSPDCGPAAGNGAEVNAAANECDAVTAGCERINEIPIFTSNNREANQVQLQGSPADEEGTYHANHSISCAI